MPLTQTRFKLQTATFLISIFFFMYSADELVLLIQAIFLTATLENIMIDGNSAVVIVSVSTRQLN